MKGALADLVDACEREFCSPETERDCSDDEAVMGGADGDSPITFGMIRRAKRELDALADAES